MRATSTQSVLAAVHRRHKLTNLMHSVLLLGGMVALLALCGWVVAGGEGVLWSFAAGAVSLLFMPRVSPRLVLAMFGARRLSTGEAPQLYEVMRALAARAELPAVPELYYIASPMLNAFTVGSRSRAAVAVSDGLLRELSLRELAGVLAHEVSHIRNNDLWVMGLADLVASLTRFMALFGTALLLLNLPLLVMDRGGVPWALVLLLTVAPTAGALLQLALSRTREFDADLDAAHLTGDPEGVASALARIDRLQERPWMPGRGGPSLLRTHPDMEERVRRLMELRPSAPVLPGWEALPIHVPFAHARHRPRYRVSGYWY
ncbi:zinc metalloprotease HtpX [Azospirillum sp.]|uniref:zinc metalloprotease HtpX n=1 Tax=Azospirillum sp. TaxID=34012 RepID=UPI003D724831